jgi:hypothetical protein
MSLKLAAQHMASRGRGPDTQLMHMAPQEVAGLQALAKAHGGSLTINPETGLAEAGFLKNLLPTLIGAGLSIASGGTLTPLMAAGITGAGYGMATGSLQKGLMAGLGAYGGAGLAGGLTAAAGTVGAGAGAAGASEMAATQAGLQQNALTSAGLPSSAAAGAGSMSFAPGMGTNVMGTAPLAGPMSVPVTTGQLAAGMPQVATATPVPAMSSISDRFAQAGKGFGALGTEAGRDAFMGNAASKGVEASGVGGGMGLLKSGYAAAIPLMMQEPAKQRQREEEKPYDYAYDSGRVSDPGAIYTGAPTGERTYFDHRFTRRAADGGLMGLGTVQAMSDRNMAETMAANGGQRFALGGVPVEQDPYYTMSGQSGDAFRYLMGQAPTPRGIVTLPVSGGIDGGLPPAGDTTEYDYTFDPVTGRYSRTVKAPPVEQPVAILPADPGGGGGDGGASAGDGTASNNAPVSNMGTDTGFGGDGANAGAPGGGNAAGGAGNSGDGGTGDSSTAAGDGPGASDGSGPGAGAGTGGAAAGDSGDGGTGAASSAGDGGASAGDGGDGGASAGDGSGWARGGLSALAMAQGGQINLQGTFNVGQGGGDQFGQANANGYQAAGGAPLKGFSSSFGQMGGGQMGEFDLHQLQASGYDPRAVQANPQGFRQQVVAEQQRRAQANAVGHLPQRPQQQMQNALYTGPVSAEGEIGIGDFMRDQFPPQSMAHVMPQRYNSFSEMNLPGFAAGGAIPQRGVSHLGDYSDGGRLLKGPGDGVSDSIPATIANKRPARLADGEFVVPARIVSELGNGSTEAGARKLYAMMDRIQKARRKTTGKNRVAVNSRSEKLLPA